MVLFQKIIGFFLPNDILIKQKVRLLIKDLSIKDRIALSWETWWTSYRDHSKTECFFFFVLTFLLQRVDLIQKSSRSSYRGGEDRIIEYQGYILQKPRSSYRRSERVFAYNKNVFFLLKTIMYFYRIIKGLLQKSRTSSYR